MSVMQIESGRSNSMCSKINVMNKLILSKLILRNMHGSGFYQTLTANLRIQLHTYIQQQKAHHPALNIQIAQ